MTDKRLFFQQAIESDELAAVTTMHLCCHGLLNKDGLQSTASASYASDTHCQSIRTICFQTYVFNTSVRQNTHSCEITKSISHG